MISYFAPDRQDKWKHDVLFVHYDPIQSRIDYKAGCALGRGFVIDKSLWQHVFRFAVRSNQDRGTEICILSSFNLLSKNGHLRLQRTNMVWAVMQNIGLQNAHPQMGVVTVGLNLHLTKTNVIFTLKWLVHS